MSAVRTFRAANALRSQLPSTLGAPRSFHASARNLAVHHIKSKPAFLEAIKSNEVVVLDCFASWCGPCKAISPILEKMSEEEANKGIHFTKIDVDDLPELSAELSIRAMPTFLFFKKGKKARELVGANPPALAEMVANFRPDQQ